MDELEVLKREFRDILSNVEISFYDFEEIYKLKYGKVIPFRRFGHDHLLSLLVALIDVVRVIPRHHAFFVRAVTLHEMQHMICQQQNSRFAPQTLLNYQHFQSNTFNQWNVNQYPSMYRNLPIPESAFNEIYQNCLEGLLNDDNLIKNLVQSVLKEISEQVRMQMMPEIQGKSSNRSPIENTVKLVLEQRINEIQQQNETHMDESDEEMPYDERNPEPPSRLIKTSRIDVQQVPKYDERSDDLFVEDIKDLETCKATKIPDKDPEILLQKVVDNDCGVVSDSIAESSQNVVEDIKDPAHSTNMNESFDEFVSKPEILFQSESIIKINKQKTLASIAKHQVPASIPEKKLVPSIETLEIKTDPKEVCETSKISVESAKKPLKAKSRVKSSRSNKNSTDWEVEEKPISVAIPAITIEIPKEIPKALSPPPVPPRSLKSFNRADPPNFDLNRIDRPSSQSFDDLESLDLTKDDLNNNDSDVVLVESPEKSPEEFFKSFTFSDNGQLIRKSEIYPTSKKQSPEEFFKSFMDEEHESDDKVETMKQIPKKSKKQVRFLTDYEQNQLDHQKNIPDSEFVKVMEILDDIETDQSEKFTVVNESFFDPSRDPMPGLVNNDPILWTNYPSLCLIGSKIKENDYSSSHHVETQRTGQFKILMSEVSSPSRFWFHYDDCACYLDEMMCKLNNFYRKKVKSKDLLMPSEYHQIGMLCVGKIFDEWTRGEIIHKSEDLVKVFFFDYGTSAYLDSKNVKFMLEIFAELPKQAIRGCLSNVRPIGGGRLWDLKISEEFLTMVTNKVIWAKTVKLMECNTLELLIVDTNQEPCSQQNVANVLVTKGLAEFHLSFDQLEQNVKNFGPYCQHYPTFEMLESGTYPSYSDRWHSLHDKGLDMNLLEETHFFAFCNEKLLQKPEVQKMLQLPEMKHIRDLLILNKALAPEQNKNDDEEE